MTVKPDIDYFAQAIDFLLLESRAISQTALRLKRDQVEGAINLLAGCRGKVVLSGIGKSGIIAQKIAATMTSTGTVAIFIHPSDALHGDLGIIGPDDCVIALSNSGETEEVLAMLPHLERGCGMNRRRVPVIAIVGKMQSSLTHQSDVALDASVDQEAGPLNLVPTASTTVALAIGDALALALMQIKGLTPEDFAQNHPGGLLGKRVTLRVRALMHSGARNPRVAVDRLLTEVVKAISDGGLGAVCVVDQTERLVGLITDGDLRRAIVRGVSEDLRRLTSKEIMTAGPITVGPEMLAYDALRMMEERPSQISVLPVVDDEYQSIGLIRLHDIVRSGLH
ncbi:MAG: KpsF/GutQ family sugar-phosphate isomerase [Pyrinomonadaceae bacterium]